MSVPNLEYINCEACGSSDTKIFISSADYCYVQCRKCGLVYLNPRYPQSSIDNLYQSSDHVVIDAKIDPSGGEALYLSRFDENIKEIEKYQKNKGKILDIGSAWGYFLSIAKKYGWDAYGVELSMTAGKYSRDRFGLNIFVGKLTEARFPSDHFDAVTLWHVLEHIAHPGQELSEIRRVLKKDGLLVVEVPSLKILREDVNHGKFIPCHLYYYDPATLRSLLERSGFHVIKIQGCGSTRIVTKAEHLKVHFIKPFVVKNFRYLRGIKKLIVRLMAAFNMQENIIVYARPNK